MRHWQRAVLAKVLPEQLSPALSAGLSQLDLPLPETNNYDRTEKSSIAILLHWSNERSSMFEEWSRRVAASATLCRPRPDHSKVPPGIAAKHDSQHSLQWPHSLITRTYFVTLFSHFYIYMVYTCLQYVYMVLLHYIAGKFMANGRRSPLEVVSRSFWSSMYRLEGSGARKAPQTAIGCMMLYGFTMLHSCFTRILFGLLAWQFQIHKHTILVCREIHDGAVSSLLFSASLRILLF
jgi:hypothetical protein